MSATNRTPGLRVKDDNYATAPWAVDRLLDELVAVLPFIRHDGMPSYWLEPCAGSGNIIRAVNGWVAPHGNIRWHACEIRPECEEALKTIANPVIIGDFLRVVPANYDVVITNPPYSLAEEIVRACLPIADHVIMLLRLNWLEGRDELWKTNPADIWVVPNRIPFGRNKHGKVGTDATAYAWYHFHAGATGAVRHLARTPKEVRAAYRKHLDATLPPLATVGDVIAEFHGHPGKPCWLGCCDGLELEKKDAGADRKSEGADGAVRTETPAAGAGVQADASASEGGAEGAPGQLDAGSAEGVCSGPYGDGCGSHGGEDERSDPGSGLGEQAKEPAQALPAGPEDFGGTDYPESASDLHHEGLPCDNIGCRDCWPAD